MIISVQICLISYKMMIFIIIEMGGEAKMQTEQNMQDNYSKEARAYLEVEVPKLEDSELIPMERMLQGQGEQELTLPQAEKMIWVAKNQEQAEKAMFNQP